MDVIVFDNVSKKYQGGYVAAENISVKIQKGEFVFVIGRSGAGKSTFLKLINGQVSADAGLITVNGKNVRELSKKDRPYFRRQIGNMQLEYGLLDELNLFDNIDLAMRVTEQPRRQAKKRVTAVMQAMGIYSKAKAYPREVSMGEAARALLARAMVIGPKILLADEPTANLDPDGAYDIMCLLDALNQQGMTVVVASHNQELVSIMRKRVITLSAGRLVADEKNAVYNIRASDVMEERRILNERTNKQLE